MGLNLAQRAHCSPGDALQSDSVGLHSHHQPISAPIPVIHACLGNYHDDANDFAHKTSIRFSMGLQVPIEAITKPLYIVASSSGCADRSSERFGNPPVSYSTYSCDQAAPSVLRAKAYFSRTPWQSTRRPSLRCLAFPSRA